MTTATETQAITKEMTIGEVIAKWPWTVDVFTARGIHCAGCGAATFETVEQGILGHGRDREELEAIIVELNAAVTEMEGVVFSVTEKAARIIQDVMEEEGHTGKSLRIKVAPGGCSGFQYEFGFEEERSPTDTVVEAHGLTVLLDEKTLPLIKGARLDYVMSIQGAGLKIHNPNAASSCGCGNSFS
ncbi:iron-sulfur cluster assembly accessory protein [bacterium]|nr:iron-sulfur cluster assembly accessory protein [bacterium]